ncbi:MAG TPA: 30S ribosomal protein S20 [Kofleriaceae bacterium]|nr:30S ribosomal protein S20 [Kofleriaceae bacterium]
MANHKQAEKRTRQRAKRQLRNRLSLGAMRTALKKARAALDAKSGEATSLVKQAVQHIDRAVTKGVLHRRNASRLIARLTRRGNTTTAA